MSNDGNNPHFAGKYFDQIDELSESENYFVPVLQDVGREIDFSSARVLDVGCGTGLFLKPVIESGCTHCYGVDGPTEFADRALGRGYKEVRTVADLSNSPIPYPNDSFDFVVCKDVFEHLLHPVYTLQEIRRVLKPGGYFLLHVPNHFPLIGRLKFLFKNDIDTFSFFKDDSRWTFPHIRFYEHGDMLRVLGKNDFALVSDLSHHFPAVSMLSRFRILSALVKYLARRYPNQFAAGFTLLVKKEKA